MPWFRFRRRKDDPAAEAATTPEEAQAPPDALAVDENDEADEAEETTATDGAAARKRRRRGSRGGKGRRKPGAAADPADGRRAPRLPRRRRSGSRRRPPRRGRARRSGQRSGNRERRRQVPRRAPLPDAKRELLISVDVGEQRVALLEDDRVAEVYLERPERRSIAGNIYVGRVDNVLPGMEAAFVEIGLEKNGFLYVDEIVVPELEGKRHGKKITDLIQRGQQILVQAVKDPMKTKGARLTTEISLPGRFLVYVPNGEGLGVSRRLEDAERNRLKDILKGIAPSTGGVIVRTAAEGASAEDIERDLVFLQRLWKTIQARQKLATGPELVYQEAELPLRIVRDLFAGDFVAAHVDSERTYKRIVGYLKKTSPHMIERVHKTKDKEPLFAKFGVDKEISSTLDRRVDLPSGGYLVFDYAEAFTVIDVNTGSFVGSRSKSSTQRLEDTIVKNNLEAVKEVVRQLRLRDIGGIVVIDFIDMANPKNRQAVEEAFRTELERDRTKTYVVEISPLGLVEMTRQKVTDGPREVMTRKCPTCAGDGIVVSDATIALQIERRLKALAVAGAGSRVQAYRIALHPQGAGTARRPRRRAAPRARGCDPPALLPRPGRGARARRPLRGPGRGTPRRSRAADVAGRGRRGRAEARRDRPPRRHRRGREARRPRRGGRGRGEARRQEGEGHDRPGARGPGVRGARRRRARGRPDHVRERGREADPRSVAPEGRRGRRSGAGGRGERRAGGRGDGRARGRGGRDARGRRRRGARARRSGSGRGRRAEDAREEADPARLARWEAPQEGTRDSRRRRFRRAAVRACPDVRDRGRGRGRGRGRRAPAADSPPVEKPAPKRRAPRIHVPDDGAAADEAPEPETAAEETPSAEADGDGAAPKKRTRRGSRGGRNRKKKTTTAANGDGAEATELSESDAAETVAVPLETNGDGAPTEPAPSMAAAEADDASADSPDEAGYVPMSEWIEDFDRRA